ncbi:MAG: hypothetical protein KKF44_05335 [Nanoarchaeota archaeon]|nr:hypothetical protein [Nanoarchaeota archaeon]
MVYFVITGNDRKQYESLKEAVTYSTEQSRIYSVDAFGNLAPLDEERINSIMKTEAMTNANIRPEPVIGDAAVSQQSNEQPTPANANSQSTSSSQVPQETGQPISQTLQKEKNLVDFDRINEKEGYKKTETVQETPPKEKELPKKKSAWGIMSYVIYFILIAIIIYVAYLIIYPYYKEFANLDKSFGLI